MAAGRPTNPVKLGFGFPGNLDGVIVMLIERARAISGSIKKFGNWWLDLNSNCVIKDDL